MEDKKSKEERYNEARILHKSLDEKLQMLQARPYLTEDEELEIKLLKKKKLYFKDTKGTAAAPGESEHQTGLAFDVTTRHGSGGLLLGN